MAEMLDLSDQEFFKIMITILRAFTEKAENIQEQKDNVNREMNILRKGPKQMLEGISLAVQWLRLRLSMQGVQIRSLVGELRSHKPRHMAKTKKQTLLSKEVQNTCFGLINLFLS